jgi:hypothetical protein
MEFDRKDQVKLKLFNLINLPIMQFSENQQLCGGVFKILYHLLASESSPAPALKRWDEIPPSIQAKLLGNVWCGICSKTVHIIVESGSIKNKDLIITGRYADCGGPVARLIEGD